MTSNEAAPRPTRAGRLLDYLQEMFPPLVMIPAALAQFAMVYLALQALAGQAPLVITWRAVAGAVTATLFMLLFRVYDELKDVEQDLAMAEAGDPRYVGRAIVTGRIRVDDLVFLRWAVTALLVVINLPLGIWPLLAFAVGFLFAWLSFNWYFWPAVSKNLILAFVTHNPLTLLLFGYIVAIYVQDFGAGGLSWWTVPLAVAYWFPVAAWETSRKIRPPEDETDYQTYTMMMGTRVAPFLPIVFMSGTAVCVVLLAGPTGIGWIFPAVAVAAAAVGVAACLRFVVAPSTPAAKLRPFAELHSLAVTVGFPIALAVAHGLTV